MELALGERIRIARTRCKKSQVELARAVGISKTTLSDIETGNTVAPSSAIITDIARVLNVSADFLLGLRDEPDSGGRSHVSLPTPPQELKRSTSEVNRKERFEKWNKWIGIIYDQVVNLSTERHIFWEVQNIIRSNKSIQKPSSFYTFLGSSYVALAVMGVRIQLKQDKQSISFAQLLREIIETPQVLSRKQFVTLYPSAVRDVADYDFDQFSGKGQEHVNPDIVKDDLEKLKALGLQCEEFADKRVAHYDKSEPKNLPTFNDLDVCIDYLEALLKKYWLLLRGKGLTSVLPIWTYDWKEIFKEPWLPPHA